MNSYIPIKLISETQAKPGALASLGHWMQRNQKAIRHIQWWVVAVYLVLLIVPVFQPMPTDYQHLYENLVLFAQFVFWGIWWPFVLLSMLLFGRLWCGVFCPEGALSEWASRRGLGRRIPRWIQWQGWPFTAFVLTTIYGQLISVYEYPKAALLILGGSTLVAMLVGFVYGKGKRVWCRYLCPVNGVFGLLSRLAPVHFKVDQHFWQQSPRPEHAVDCPTLLNVKQLASNQKCHMCGRCSDYRQSISLSLRSTNQEVKNLKNEDVSRWEVLLLVYGLLGVAVGAFQWSASPWFVWLKQNLALWLIKNQVEWPLLDNAPWWLLTHYPEFNDSFSWLDGGLILFYIIASALLLGSVILFLLYCSARLLGQTTILWHLAYGLTPVAAFSTFLGLFSLTISMLRAEYIDMSWVAPMRWMILIGAVLWSAWLLWEIISNQRSEAWLARTSARIFTPKAVMAWVVACTAAILIPTLWVQVFFFW